MTTQISDLEAQEQELVFDTFDAIDALDLGTRLTEAARAAGHRVGIDIRKSNVILYRAMLPGVTPDQEVWIGRKAAVVLRMENSSALVDAKLSAAGVDPVAIGWLDESYAVTGGSFPIRVRGVGVVAAATASGLSSEDDHNLIVDGIRAYLAEVAGTGAAARAGADR